MDPKPGTETTAINPLTCKFRDKEMEARYEHFLENSLQAKIWLVSFYIFAAASTFQYCGVAPLAISGQFGWSIRLAFVCWYLGFSFLTFSMILEVFVRVQTQKDNLIFWRNRATDLFIVMQPLVHGSLIYGRTISPRECHPLGYADTTRSVQSIMEEQMTCNTTDNGRVPPELTLAMGVFMLVHQYVFINVGWNTFTLHWLLGFCFLVMAHLTTATRQTCGEAFMILGCFVGILLVLYSTERRRREYFMLKVQLQGREEEYKGRITSEHDSSQSQERKSNENTGNTGTSEYDIDLNYGNPPMGIRAPKRQERWEDSSVSSITMNDAPNAMSYGVDPYDDYDKISLASGAQERKSKNMM